MHSPCETATNAFRKEDSGASHDLQEMLSLICCGCPTCLMVHCLAANPRWPCLKSASRIHVHFELYGPSPASARPPAPPPRREHRISNLTPIAHPARRGSTGLLWRVAGGPEAGLGCGPLVGWLPGSRHRGAQAWGIRGRSALDAGVRAGRRAGRAGMGLALGKRVGSDPYYASYERSFEHLSSELHRLEVRDKPASAPGQALRALTAVCACLGTGGPEEGPAPGDREGYRQLWPGRLCAGGSVRGLGKARQQGHNLWRLARAPIACSPIWLWRRY